METITKKLVNNVEKTNSSALLITLALRRNQNFPRKITVTRLVVECLSTVGAAEAKETNHFPFHPVWNYQNFPLKITVTCLAVEYLSTVGSNEAKETNHFPFHPFWT